MCCILLLFFNQSKDNFETVRKVKKQKYKSWIFKNSLIYKFDNENKLDYAFIVMNIFKI